MKDFNKLEKDLIDSDIGKKAMEIAQFIFSNSQENLIKPMPWGDDTYPSSRRPTVISDTGGLLQSGVPPYWEKNNRISMQYTAPHAKWVEWGTPPHVVSHKHFIKWAEKKLKIRPNESKIVAYKIANKIRKEGISPHPFIRPAVFSAVKKYDLKVQYYSI